jgi:hypothetical protein
MLKIVSDEVVKDGKVIKPAVFEVQKIQKFNLTEAMLLQRRARITKELSEIDALLLQMKPAEPVKE